MVIPFAGKLTFPSSWMRTRRDHARFLNLIEVSAFLHQYQRERRSGAIVASVADYAVAYALAGEVLTETLGDLPKPLREALARIQAMATAEGGVSRREIREALALPDSTVRGWLAELVELEYLEVEAGKGGTGNKTRYRAADRRAAAGGPRPAPPEELARKTCETCGNMRTGSRRFFGLSSQDLSPNMRTSEQNQQGSVSRSPSHRRGSQNREAPQAL